MKPIAVTVVVSSKDRLHMLMNLLSSLSKCTKPVNVAISMIVIDNASQVPYPADCLSSVHKHIPSRLVRHDLPGRSRALNQVISEIETDYIIFLDDDVIVPPDLVVDYVNAFQRGTSGMLAGKVMLCDELRTKLSITGINSLAHFMPTTTTVGSVIGANFACTTQVFKAIGGLDIALGPGALLSLGDDTLFGYEYVRRFGAIPVCGTSPVVHYPDRERTTLESQIKFVEMSSLAEAYIHRKLGQQSPKISLVELLKVMCTFFVVTILRFAVPVAPQLVESYLATYRKLRLKLSLLAFSK